MHFSRMAEPGLFGEQETQFADVLVPVPVARLFTYRVPNALAQLVKKGQRVIVPFGQKKILTGIIASVHTHPPQEYEAKYILELLDEEEAIYDQQFQLYQWMADYYLCTAGEVLNAALPSGLKLSSESMIQLRPGFVLEESTFDFSEKERILLANLQASENITYSDAAKLLGVKSIYSLIKSLTSKEAIILFEQVKEKFKPKTENHIRLTPFYVDKKNLEALFERLGSKPKQEAVLLKYLQEIPVFSHPEINTKGIAKAKILDAEISESSIRTLIKNKILEEFDVVIPRFGFPEATGNHPLLLSEGQEKARNEILQHFEKLDTVLLHGVTGSGKTEIYIDLIRRAIDSGSQVLYLLPEIALTTQIVQRLKKIFGADMGVYHSLKHLRRGILDASRLNQINAR